VVPSTTTEYTLVAVNDAGERTKHLTITVNQPVSSGPGLVLDVLAAAPMASWTSAYGANVLPWNGAEQDDRGFAAWKSQAVLADGSHPSLVLETIPARTADGHIVGDIAMPRPIQPGDHFRARIGFLQGASGAVQVIVAAHGGTLPSTPAVVTVNLSTGGDLTRDIDADLSPVAGGATLRLIVRASAAGGQNWVAWENPRVEH
jgi:hypothetical protein